MDVNVGKYICRPGEGLSLCGEIRSSTIWDLCSRLTHKPGSLIFAPILLKDFTFASHLHYTFVEEGAHTQKQGHQWLDHYSHCYRPLKKEER